MPLARGRASPAKGAPAAPAARRRLSRGAGATPAGRKAAGTPKTAATKPAVVERPPFDRFECLRELGRGTCGTVLLVRRRSDGTLLAMKSIVLPPLASRDERALSERKQALREVDILKSLESAHVLRHRETLLVPPSANKLQSELHILTEYCNGGDLCSYIRREHDSKGLTERDVWNFAAAILAGLCDLHAQRIVHRDLKPANIFLKKVKPPALPPRAHSAGRGGGLRSKLSLSMRRRRADVAVELGSNDSGGSHEGFPATGMDCKVLCLVGDLGIARTITATQPMAETMVGTPLYCAPEIFEGEPYDEKADIYSFGVCVYELMHGRPPWADVQSVAGLVRHVLALDGDLSEHEVHMDRRFSEDLRQIVLDCMSRNATNRPTAVALSSRFPEEYRRAIGLDVAAAAAAKRLEPLAGGEDGAGAVDVEELSPCVATPPPRGGLPPPLTPSASPPLAPETPGERRSMQAMPRRSLSGHSPSSRCESPFAFRPPERTPSPAAHCGVASACRHRSERDGLVVPAMPLLSPFVDSDAPPPLPKQSQGRCLASMLESVLTEEEPISSSALLSGAAAEFGATLRLAAEAVSATTSAGATEDLDETKRPTFVAVAISAAAAALAAAGATLEGVPAAGAADLPAPLLEEGSDEVVLRDGHSPDVRGACVADVMMRPAEQQDVAGVGCLHGASGEQAGGASASTAAAEAVSADGAFEDEDSLSPGFAELQQQQMPASPDAELATPRVAACGEMHGAAEKSSSHASQRPRSAPKCAARPRSAAAADPGQRERRGSKQSAGGPMAYVVRAHECWAKWRKEKVDARAARVDGASEPAGGGTFLASAGVGASPAVVAGKARRRGVPPSRDDDALCNVLEIRGMAPARTPKVLQQAGRL
mmetsp:Transcript_92116/g.265800  ORF Transcript_92116/g.265800 Transcript_92116/m.265800 type:complete len:884 (+) Transcript_92116:205-2856(+)